MIMLNFILVGWGLYLILVWRNTRHTRRQSVHNLMLAMYDIVYALTSTSIWPYTWYNVLIRDVSIVLFIVHLGLMIAALHDERDNQPIE